MKRLTLLVLAFLLTGCVYGHQEEATNKTFPSMDESVLKDDDSTSSDSNPANDDAHESGEVDSTSGDDKDDGDNQEPPLEQS